MRLEEKLCFDDVLLVPQYSNVMHRVDVDLSTLVGPLKLKIPIVSSNMDTITGYEMAKTIGKLGGLGILHRFTDPEIIADWVKRLSDDNIYAVPSIGVSKEDYNKASLYLDSGADMICVDVAHGDHLLTTEIVDVLAKISTIPIMVGNVVTYEGAKRLVDCGASVIKVGVGPGSRCLTRNATGHGFPQLSAIEGICVKLSKDITVIADGGLRNSGDCVKALAVGADALMFGGLLSGTDETPGQTVSAQDGSGIGKVFRGMASRDALLDFKGEVRSDYASEGDSIIVPLRGSVVNVVEELIGGIKSGCSYSGACNLSELRELARFIKVTPNVIAENNVRLP